MVRKVGGGGGSGISNAYSHPPNCDLIFVESGGKLYTQGREVIQYHYSNMCTLVRVQYIHVHMVDLSGSPCVYKAGWCARQFTRIPC